MGSEMCIRDRLHVWINSRKNKRERLSRMFRTRQRAGSKLKRRPAKTRTRGRAEEKGRRLAISTSRSTRRRAHPGGDHARRSRPGDMGVTSWNEVRFPRDPPRVRAAARASRSSPRSIDSRARVSISDRPTCGVAPPLLSPSNLAGRQVARGRRAAPRGDPRAAPRERERVPVSYTHLTLPTICSV